MRIGVILIGCMSVTGCVAGSVPNDSHRPNRIILEPYAGPAVQQRNAQLEGRSTTRQVSRAAPRRATASNQPLSALTPRAPVKATLPVAPPAKVSPLPPAPKEAQGDNADAVAEDVRALFGDADQPEDEATTPTNG